MVELEGEWGFLYLEFEDVIALYADMVGCTDQEARDQLRDPAGLEGALNRPRFFVHYRGADLALQAAVLTHGIAEGQYFIDRNKRIAHAAMRSFLLINGYRLDAPQSQRAGWIIQLSEGGTVEGLAEQIRAVLVPVE